MKMASKALSSIALLLSLNLLFSNMVCSTSTYVTVPPSQKCPIDTLKLGVCANVLGLVEVQVGSPPTLPCCSLIQGLADLEIAACLCSALKANVLGLNLNIPLSLSIILNNCGKNDNVFQCP